MGCKWVENALGGAPCASSFIALIRCRTEVGAGFAGGAAPSVESTATPAEDRAVVGGWVGTPRRDAGTRQTRGTPNPKTLEELEFSGVCAALH